MWTAGLGVPLLAAISASKRVEVLNGVGAALEAVPVHIALGAIVILKLLWLRGLPVHVLHPPLHPLLLLLVSFDGLALLHKSDPLIDPDQLLHDHLIGCLGSL